MSLEFLHAPDELVNLLLSWMHTPDWSTSQTYLQAHPELLTETATQVHASLIQHQTNQQIREILMLHQQLLQIAIKQGVKVAYRYLLHKAEKNDSTATEQQEDLQAYVLTWLQALDWETSQTYLQSHPQLLTDAAEQIMKALKRAQEEQQVQTTINLHLALLQIARVEGIKAAYKYFLSPQMETPINNQEVASQQNLQYPATLNDAGVVAYRQYRVNGQVATLNQAVECWQETLKLTPSNSPQRSKYLSNLGNGLRDRYRYGGELTDLEAAISAYQQAVQATPSNSPEWPILLSNLGNGLRDRYRYGGELTDLEAAISAYQQAVQATPSNSPEWPTLLSRLGTGLRDRYHHSGDSADLEAAISAFQQAVQATPPDPLNWPTLLSRLGSGLRDRYHHSGDLADLEAAISAYQQAVQATSSDSPNWPILLGNLGNGLRNRYIHTGNLTDLEAAISAYQQAVQATSSDSSERPGALNSLGNGLRDRYTQTGNLADLEAAISAYQQAVQATSSNSPLWPTYLSNIGVGLRDRYTQTGNLADLEAAIITFQQAVQATSLNSPKRPIQLSNLGIGLRDRSARTGDLADLEAAISAFQQAVQATPLDSPERSRNLSNLGAGLGDRSARTGDLADLEAAISTFQQAVQAIPPDSPYRAILLDNLGLGMLDRSARSRSLADLEAAISALQQAVQATPLDSPERPRNLSNLGAGLSARYHYSGNLIDLEASITALQQAVQAIPLDSPERSRNLNSLGIGLHDRYVYTRNVDDLQAAIATWEKSWSIPHQDFAALPVTYQLEQQRQSADVAASLVTAYLEQAKQGHSRLISVSNRALEIVEGSKSRLLTQLVGRGPLPLPSGLSKEIAAQELQLLTELTALDTQELVVHGHFAFAQEETNHLQRLQLRQATLHSLESLWTHIASLDLEGPAYVALRRGAVLTWQEFGRLTKALGSATALLSFFRTPDRALLFLLRSGWRAPRVVEIPMNRTGWTDLLERFYREVHRYGPNLRRGETWDQPLRPLLTKAQSYVKGVERLILAPAGSGHLLPWSVLVERSGWHTSAGQPLSLVTLPALGILPRLRQRPHVPPGPALIIGNPRGDLPYAEVESNMVAEHFGMKPLLRAAATKSAVLTRLPEATLIHLATHAFFDADNPLESGIVLADGVLTAREVLQHRLQADLLVLSACESGQVGSLGGEELAGLSQAFLQTGVRSLLVSLWRVNDPATAAFIQAFYTARQAGADKALALQQAMTQIQQDPRWTHPYYWGAFVLMGDWD